jgi:hypothetical protein
MTDVHAGLRLYREQLRAAIDADLRRRTTRVRPRRPLRLLVPALAAAAAAIAAVAVLTSGGQVQSADAAVLRHVAAALTPQAGSILHERALVTVEGRAPQPYELWARADGSAYRVIKFGHEFSSDGSSGASYDPVSNTITVSPSGTSAPDDAATTLRGMVDSGAAHVDGAVTLDGRPAYQLTVSGATPNYLNGTVWVARDSYRPLRIVTSFDDPSCGGGCSETISYLTYEYLPADADNMKLLDVAAQHPGAQTVSAGSGQYGGTTTTGK